MFGDDDDDNDDTSDDLAVPGSGPGTPRQLLAVPGSWLFQLWAVARQFLAAPGSSQSSQQLVAARSSSWWLLADPSGVPEC